jgi:hypothetical protein
MPYRADRQLFDRRTMLAVAGGALLPLAPGIAAGSSLVVGPGGQPLSLRQAIQQARDGDTIDLLPGAYRGEVAVVEGKRLAIRGIGRRPVLHAEGRNAEGKAILVVRGGEVIVENIEFRGCRSADRNGAGIRLDSGSLRAVRCAFFDNENGLLTGNAEDATLAVEACEFGEAPRVVGGLHHLLYVGRIASVTITGSRFHRGFEGHLVKSRARRSTIAYNLIYDGPEGEASYEVDLPNGGFATLVGNVIGQAPGSQNFALVAYGAEGRPWPDSRLHVSHNTFVNGRTLPALFLRVFRDRLAAGTQVLAVNNLTVGLGALAMPADGRFEGNYPAVSAMLRDPDAMAFELAPGSVLRGRGVDPATALGVDLTPAAEFAFPVGTRALRAPPHWSPGAFQS